MKESIWVEDKNKAKQNKKKTFSVIFVLIKAS